MTSPVDVPAHDRRRFARGAAAAQAELLLDGVPPLSVDSVADVSEGGTFVACASPPRLGTSLVVRIRRDGEEASVRARVVRVVWGGRDRGARLSGGAALAFEDEPERRARAITLLAPRGR